MENIQIIKKGLNGTQLKLLGAFLMVLDHIHQCFTATPYVAPLWFNCLGRLVAPIFLYLAAQGMYYTKNRKKYLLRLYIASNLMGVGNYFIQNVFPTDRLLLINNIFFTIFTGCWLIFFIDLAIESFKEKNIKKGVLSTIGILIPFLSTQLIFISMKFIGPLSLTCLPNIFVCEGGILFIFLIVAFYYGRNSKMICILALSIVAIMSFVSGGTSITIENLLTNIQWMMGFTSIFILLYNGQKGNGYKSFFYIFYPTHLYTLYIIGWLLAGGK